MPVAERADSVRVRVPAKVNLHLSIGAARADGFHDLVTVFQAVSVFDDVVAREADGLHLSVSGSTTAPVPLDEDNLAWQAAALLAERCKRTPDVAIELHKHIPVAGGLAGGSADAAATLVACAQLWHTGSSKPQLSALAAELGSDVAFGLFGGTALGTGRGEQLSPVLSVGEYHWVLAYAEDGLSTTQAYRELDRLRSDGAAPEPIGGPDDVLDAVRSGDCGRLADALGNDLEAAAVALRPELADLLRTGAELGALAGIVSGSGPTCAFLCPHAEAAADLAVELDDSGQCVGTLVATAPAHGARIVG